MRIVLASASPRRKELLTQMGIQFDIIESSVDEKNIHETVPENIAMLLAKRKALDVAAHICQQAIVIGADTIVVKDGILGKPKNESEAFEMLKKLQGQTHEVITGLFLVDTHTGKYISSFERTIVRMAPLSQHEIKEYVETGESMDKAGAYAVQGRAGKFIEGIDGCYFNVVGLPINSLWMMLKEFGVKS